MDSYEIDQLNGIPIYLKAMGNVVTPLNGGASKTIKITKEMLDSKSIIQVQ